MKPIDQIVVCCCARDVWLTRICVASIRYWYPDRPIGLLKDTSLGDFDTSELESIWNVSNLKVADSNKGYYMKLEACYFPGKQRFLILDSDTVFLGRFLEDLEKFDEDFVGHWSGRQSLSPSEKEMYAANGYYRMPELKKMFPDFEPPDFFFNGGHLLITSGLLAPEDFARFLTDTKPPIGKYPAIFPLPEQGIFNFAITQKLRDGKCTIGTHDFVKFSADPHALEFIEVEQLKSRNGYPFLVHWAQGKAFFASSFLRPDILHFFENYYYAAIPNGTWKRRVRLARRFRHNMPRRWKIAFTMDGQEPDFQKLFLLEENPPKDQVAPGAIFSLKKPLKPA